MADEEKDDWLDDLDDGDDDASELDQSDIDALLSGTDDSDTGSQEEDAPQDDSVDADGELDQSDIDALLSGSDDSGSESDEPPASEAVEEDDGDGELDQSDIDALLSGSDEPTDLSEEAGATPDQDEIDELFSEVDDGEITADEDPFQAEEINFDDIVGDIDGEESYSLEEGTAFDAEAFGLDDDIPEIPEVDSDDETIFDQGDETVLSDEPTQLLSDEDPPDPEALDSDKKFNLPPVAIPAILQDRRNQTIAGGLLLLLLIAGIYMFSGNGENPDQVAQQEATDQTEQAKKQSQQESKKVNTAPQVSDIELRLIPGSNELAIALTGQDAENDPLEFEILSIPEKGKLSGQAPNLTYAPGKDFSDTDTFMFRVSDGTAVSDPATVKILAPAPALATTPQQPKEPVASTPKPIRKKSLSIAASGKTYTLNSTDSLLIDWEDLWNESNYLPFSKKVKVEILSDNLHGTITRIDNRQYDYQPDHFFGGKETIKYRFKLGKMTSKVRKLTLKIRLGNPAPEIRLSRMAPAYRPGQTVMVDASPSRDEDRSTLSFSWQQVSGVPVQLEVLNNEGSQIAFVVPSSFNTIANPGPLLRLTTVDEDGQKDVKDIKISTRSRRPTAMWRGLTSGGIAEDPQCPYGDCPGSMLPWPYRD